MPVSKAESPRLQADSRQAAGRGKPDLGLAPLGRAYWSKAGTGQRLAGTGQRPYPGGPAATVEHSTNRISR